MQKDMRHRKDSAKLSGILGIPNQTHQKKDVYQVFLSIKCLSVPKINFIPHFFLDILQRFCKFFIWVLSAWLTLPTKIDSINL